MIYREAWYREADERQLRSLEERARKAGYQGDAWIELWRLVDRMGSIPDLGRDTLEARMRQAQEGSRAKPADPKAPTAQETESKEAEGRMLWRLAAKLQKMPDITVFELMDTPREFLEVIPKMRGISGYMVHFVPYRFNEEGEIERGEEQTRYFNRAGDKPAPVDDLLNVPMQEVPFQDSFPTDDPPWQLVASRPYYHFENQESPAYFDLDLLTGFDQVDDVVVERALIYDREPEWVTERFIEWWKELHE
jgi:hypothetical protein